MDRDGTQQPSGNFEGQLDALVKMPPQSDHKVCADCGTEYFLPERCPQCAERDRLAAKQSGTTRHALKTEVWAHIPQGTLTYTGPWMTPDWRHPSAEGDFKVSFLDESDRRLTWACILLPDEHVTWVKASPKFGVYLYKKHTRPEATSH